jgi:glucokinase
MVCAAARLGDEFSLSVIETAGRALGCGIGTVCALLGIQTVVVGGGIAAALDLLRPFIDIELRSRSRLVGEIAVLPAYFGDHAGAVGAALWAGNAPAAGRLVLEGNR